MAKTIYEVRNNANNNVKSVHWSVLHRVYDRRRSQSSGAGRGTTDAEDVTINDAPGARDDQDQTDRFSGKCWTCGNSGHRKSDCPSGPHSNPSESRNNPKAGTKDNNPIAKRLGGKRPTDDSADKGKTTHTIRERKEDDCGGHGCDWRTTPATRCCRASRGKSNRRRRARCTGYVFFIV
jgi:hypothetical protein